MSREPLLLTYEAAARELTGAVADGGVHANTIRNLVRRGQLIATMVGDRPFISREALLDFIRENTR